MVMFKRLATSLGNARGPKKPTQRLKSKSAIPLTSATVGMSGATLERLPVDTASSLTLPPCINGTAAGNPGIHVSADDVVERRRRALVRYVRELVVELEPHQLSGEMAGRADAGRSKGHRAVGR